jgi:predicted regulator of Ras-like GTPase activity (Roadblock/LC7/MglB family)
MNEYLEPLSFVPGVRLAALITLDGVPISLVKSAAAKAAASTDRALPDRAEDFAAYAGLAVGWLGQVARATDPLTWNRPRRAVLRGTRGTLVMSRADNVILMVVTEQGVSAEDLRLPMESTLARMQRHLHGSRTPRNGPQVESPLPEPPSALPKPPRTEQSLIQDPKNCFSESSGDN